MNNQYYLIQFANKKIVSEHPLLHIILFGRRYKIKSALTSSSFFINFKMFQRWTNLAYIYIYIFCPREIQMLKFWTIVPVKKLFEL